MNKHFNLQFYILFIIFISCSFFFSSCKKDDPPVISNEKLLDNYSSIEVEVSATPFTIDNILNASYTHAESRYGQWWKIDFFVNNDGSFDVLWMDAQETMHLSRITPGIPPVAEEIELPSVINTSGRSLGIEKLNNDTFILGYSKDNSYGDYQSEAWFTAFDIYGTVKFSTCLFGQDNLEDADTDGQAGSAGSSVVKYNEKTNELCLYMSHTHRFGESSSRHQGGWVGFLDPETGELLLDENDEQIGSTWFVSHNLNQKCIPSINGGFYGLYHGDGYPRALGISKFSSTEGVLYKSDFYDIIYGSFGQPETKAQLGNLIELPDGNIALVYSTEDLRSKRDLKLVILSGTTQSTSNTHTIINETWITNYSDIFVGWGSRVTLFGDNLLVAWNTFTDSHTSYKTNFVLCNMQGEIISDVESLDEVSLYPSQSFKSSPDGKTIYWVSSGNGNTLQIHSLSTSSLY